MITGRWLSISASFLLFTFITIQAQTWVELMEDPSVNFYDIQKSFNEYWEDKTIERGKGWKQFKRWEYFMEPRVFPSGKIPDPDQASRAFSDYLQEYN